MGLIPIIHGALDLRISAGRPRRRGSRFKEEYGIMKGIFNEKKEKIWYGRPKEYRGRKICRECIEKVGKGGERI